MTFELTTLDTLWLIGLISAALSVIAYLPYTLDTFLGRCQPQRASWLIWSVLGTVALASQISEGASPALWFAAIQVGGTVMIFALSLWRGSGAVMRRSDYKVLMAAGFGVWLWYLTDTAAFALAISIGVSLLGGIVTVAKAFAHPESETRSFWIWSAASAVLAMVSVGAWKPMLLAYPTYIFLLSSAIVLAIQLGRQRGDALTLSQLRAVGAELELSHRARRVAGGV